MSSETRQNFPPRPNPNACCWAVETFSLGCLPTYKRGQRHRRERLDLRRSPGCRRSAASLSPPSATQPGARIRGNIIHHLGKAPDRVRDIGTPSSPARPGRCWPRARGRQLGVRFARRGPRCSAHCQAGRQADGRRDATAAATAACHKVPLAALGSLSTGRQRERDKRKGGGGARKIWPSLHLI
ncbi:hypothetical protein GQ53DRAFT_467553 [Thozetella sp. PMI_491]|nr:hypothetical protein GQ53DRAFT_467553 [Thozetella sp. PMI_491]